MGEAMGGGGPRRIGAFLTGGLSRAVAAYLDEMTRLRAAWQAQVPEPLASRARPVRISQGELHLHVDTPVWASRLRQQQLTLVARLSTDPCFRGVHSLRIKVIPPISSDDDRGPITAVRRGPLSSATGRLLESVAAGIGHPLLRASLLRLAQRSGGKPAKDR